ncbi:hypothetical protein Taro_011724 [Colocasia esculenta]|uniref:Uncharacterized protein n=1 Tax=Colocasia esculenta TaxID=4460 RepID=A0A843UBH1_COLES|nr:hypothetical protein [Colocasia esculenta]
MMRQAGQRSSQTHGQWHNTLTRNAQADCNTDSPTGNNDSSALQREREQRQPKQTRTSFGKNLHQKHQEPSWENITRTQPNEMAHFKPQGQHNRNLTRTQGNQAMHLNPEGNATTTRNEHNTVLGKPHFRKNQ